MSRPTVLHIDDASTWRGGQQQVLYLHQGLLVSGWDSRVVCKKGSAFHERLREERLPHYALPLSGGHDLVSAWQIGRLAREADAILHAHTSHAHDLGLWASRAGARRGLVVSRRVDFPVGRGFLGRKKYLSRRVSLYLAISSAVERELVEGGVDPARIRRVPSGIDFRRFENVTPDVRWREQLGLAPGELLFGNVAALAPHKDQATLLEAFARFREQGGLGQLVILGEGELRPSLERQRQALGLEGVVHLPGFVDDVLPKVAALDVFVMSSSTEGLGTSILDAMALGRPVAATAAGGIVDAVLDGVNGVLSPPGDPDALAASLLRLQRSAALRAEFGHAGRVRAEEFDVRRTVEKTLDAYRELLDDGAGS